MSTIYIYDDYKCVKAKMYKNVNNILLQPDGENLEYFKLWLFDTAEFIF